jgi:hypothetical protein
MASLSSAEASKHGHPLTVWYRTRGPTHSLRIRTADIQSTLGVWSNRCRSLLLAAQPPRRWFTVVVVAASTSAGISVLATWLWGHGPSTDLVPAGTVTITYEPLTPEVSGALRGAGAAIRPPVTGGTR